MIRRLLLLLILLPLPLLAQSGSTGGTVRSTGTIAANDCVKFVSKNVITSSGAACAAGGGSGTVTSVLGTANQIVSDGSTTTPTLSIANPFTFPGTVTNNLSIFGATTSAQLAGVVSDETGSGALVFAASPTFTGTITGAAQTLSGILTLSQNAAASAAAVNITGTTFSGTGTTSVPLVYINAGSAPSSWSTNGTEIGINAASGFSGNFIDYHINGGASVYKVDSNGNETISGTMKVGGSASYQWASSSIIKAPSDAVISFTGSSTSGFTRLDFGGTTSSFTALGTTATTITAQLADGTAGGIFAASKYATVANCSNAASPAVCAAANAGVVAVPTGTNPTLTINTTAVTANSEIFLGIDESATIAATTCNTTLSTLVQPVVTARTAATSFTIQIGAIIATNPACVSYYIMN